MSQDTLYTNPVGLQRVGDLGPKIYKKIKSGYEPKHNGKFLAIEVDSGKAYMAKTSAEALDLARKNHPDKMFYIAKIGFEAAETIVSSYFR